MKTVSDNTYKRQAEWIYSKAFTDRYIGWCFSTKQPVAMTFLRKYNDELARHDDVTEFIINKLPKLLANEPQLFTDDVWADATPLHSNLRARLFTIYKNYSINRWNRYKTINKYETPEVPDMTTASPNIDLVRAITYRKLWIDYTADLTTTDKIIAMYLLDGALTMKELEAATGLKKSAIYIRIDKIKADLEKMVDEKMSVAND